MQHLAQAHQINLPLIGGYSDSISLNTSSSYFLCGYPGAALFKQCQNHINKK